MIQKKRIGNVHQSFSRCELKLINIDKKTLQILDIDHFFVIETQIMNLSFYYRVQYIILNPREDEWNYKLLSVFLKSLNKLSSYFFFKFISLTEEWHESILNIFPIINHRQSKYRNAWFRTMDIRKWKKGKNTKVIYSWCFIINLKSIS